MELMKSSVWEERQRGKCGDGTDKGGYLSWIKQTLGSERMEWASDLEPMAWAYTWVYERVRYSLVFIST